MLHWRARTDEVHNLYGAAFSANMQLDGRRPVALEGEGRLSCRFKGIPLLPQAYTIQMAIRSKNGRDWMLPYQEVAAFNVSAPLEDYGFRSEVIHRFVGGAVPVLIPYEWTHPDGSVDSGRDQEGLVHRAPVGTGSTISWAENRTVSETYAWDSKVVLVTGGTGSFGRRFLQTLLTTAHRAGSSCSAATSRSSTSSSRPIGARTGFAT